MKKITGEVIRSFRHKAKMSQDDLINITDMSKAFLSDIERGVKLPSLLTLEKIAAALDLPMWKIVKEIEDRKQ